MDNQLSIVNKVTNKIIIDAARRNAQSIHIEAHEKSVMVRFTINEIPYEIMCLPLKMREDFITCIKTRLKIDIAQKEIPQSHQIRLRVLYDKQWHTIVYRISSTPTTSSDQIILNCISSQAL